MVVAINRPSIYYSLHMVKKKNQQEIEGNECATNFKPEKAREQISVLNKRRHELHIQGINIW